MIRMNRLVTNILLLLALFGDVYVLGEVTELSVLDVGQANFVILKNKEYALIFDCGAQSPSTWLDQKNKTFTTAKQYLLKNILDGAKSIKVLISHNHDDHKNLKQALSKFAQDKKEKEARTIEIYESWSMTEEKISKTIANALGQQVKIEVLHGSEGNKRKPNDCCVVLKICTNGRVILLPGDATERIIKRIEEHVKDVDIVLFSHHGSNNDQELKLLENMKAPALGIISSNVKGSAKIPKFFPDYKNYNNRGRDFLSMMDKFKFSINDMDTGNFCMPHNISFYNQLIEDYQTIPVCSVEKSKINIYPIFSTGDIGKRKFFYKIEIKEDGKIEMTQNGEDVLFMKRKKKIYDQGEASEKTRDEIYTELQSDISKLVQTVSQEVRDTHERIAKTGIFDNFKSLSINQLAEAMIKLKYSDYIANLVRLDYLTNLQKQMNMMMDLE